MVDRRVRRKKVKVLLAVDVPNLSEKYPKRETK